MEEEIERKKARRGQGNSLEEFIFVSSRSEEASILLTSRSCMASEAWEPGTTSWILSPGF